MEKRYGKKIDLAKLKPNIIHNLKKHLRGQLKMIKFLAKNRTPILQKSCYICGSDKFSKKAVIHGFTYVECKECGHLFTTKRFSEEAIRDFYKTNKYHSKITYANKKVFSIEKSMLQNQRLNL
jgi:hypothetical protein